MSLDLIWSNIASYCLQIGLLIGVAAFIPTVLRLAEPRARLAFWHILLAACLVLPLLRALASTVDHHGRHRSPWDTACPWRPPRQPRAG